VSFFRAWVFEISLLDVERGEERRGRVRGGGDGAWSMEGVGGGGGGKGER